MKKRIFFICCALFAAITIVTAQDNTCDKKVAHEAKQAEMVKKVTERMKNQLSLTDEQAAKVEELNKEFLPKMRKGHPGMRHNKENCPDSICPQKECPKDKAECKKTENCCKETNKCCKETNKCCKAPKDNKPTKEQIEKRKAEMSETRKAYIAKLNEILTPEQQEKYKSLSKERPNKRKK